MQAAPRGLLAALRSTRVAARRGFASSVAHKPVVSIEFPGVEQPRAEDTLCVEGRRSPPAPLCAPHSRARCRVDIVFVNYAGSRTRVPAKIGESILAAATRAKYTFVDGERDYRSIAGG